MLSDRVSVVGVCCVVGVVATAYDVGTACTVGRCRSVCWHYGHECMVLNVLLRFPCLVVVMVMAMVLVL